MDILTLKSKVKLGCNMCDKCCVYRGDIRLLPINVCRISKYLNISVSEFVEKYTDRVEESKLELVLKTVGELRQCILYDNNIKGCGIHKVKPMQCVMFPLVPENLKRDYFYDSGQCRLEDAKEITVNEWVNGNNKIYSKNKKICMEWIQFIEWSQTKINEFSDNEIDELNKVLFENYNLKKLNLVGQMKKNMYKVEKIIKEKTKNKNTH